MEDRLKRKIDETEEEYLWRVGRYVDAGEYRWLDIKDIINKEFGIEEDKWRDESAFRKRYQAARKFYDNVFAKMLDSNLDNDAYIQEINELNRQLEKNKIKLRDERRAWNKQTAIETRYEETFEIIEDEMKKFGKVNFNIDNPPTQTSDNDLIVMLTDLHIGSSFETKWGVYNSDVAKMYLEEYLEEIIKIQNRHNSENCYVSLQGDLISGFIHKTIQITNKENTIEQVRIASELISSFCYKLCGYFKNVYFQSVSGNHTRLEKKDEAMHDERLDDLIAYTVCLSLKHTENFVELDNKVDTSIGVLPVRNKVYIQVHGDFDQFSKNGVANLVTFLGFIPYAILSGHMHHMQMDEVNGIKMIQSGSLTPSGDWYTVEKRLYSKASQTVLVCTNKGVEAVYPVVFG